MHDRGDGKPYLAHGALPPRVARERQSAEDVANDGHDREDERQNSVRSIVRPAGFVRVGHGCVTPRTHVGVARDFAPALSAYMRVFLLLCVFHIHSIP